MKIDEQDLRIDVFRNETECTVSVTHIPTGLHVNCGKWKSQYMNRKAAIQELEEKLDARQSEEE